MQEQEGNEDGQLEVDVSEHSHQLSLPLLMLRLQFRDDDSSLGTEDER
jgi:hypothetical protein